MVNSNSTCFCAALTQRKETKPFIWIACLTDYKSIPAQNEVLKGCGEFSFSMRGERESSVRCAHFPPRVPIFSTSHPGWVTGEVSPIPLSFSLSRSFFFLFLVLSLSLFYLPFSLSLSSSFSLSLSYSCLLPLPLLSPSLRLWTSLQSRLRIYECLLYTGASGNRGNWRDFQTILSMS